jgi:SOS-response transcriptional repressor LexA
MIKRELTERQAEVLNLLVDQVEKDGTFPSLRDVQSALDYKSTNSVYQIMQALRKKGYIVKHGDYYDFAREHFFLSPVQQNELRKLFHEMLGSVRHHMQHRNLDPTYIEQQCNNFQERFERIMPSA